MREQYDPEKFHKDVEPFDEVNYITEMARNSTLYGYYGEQFVEWSHFAGSLDHRIELQRATVAIAIRHDKGSLGIKVTDAAIREEVSLNADLNKLVIRHREAEQQARLYKNAADSLDRRGKLLQSYSSQRKNEIAFVNRGPARGPMDASIAIPLQSYGEPVDYKTYYTPRLGASTVGVTTTASAPITKDMLLQEWQTSK